MSGPLDEHYCYLADRAKVERYKAAIERAVRPGQLVMDLGCGSGLLGLIALHSGAYKVLFLEKDPIIEVARRTVIDAGFGDRAEFYHTSSYELRLIDRVDVIICDHVGYFGLDYGILALLADARHRFLDPDGTIVPADIDLKLAPVETGTERELISRWTNGSISPDYAWVGAPAANYRYGVHLGSDSLLAAPGALATLELGETAEEFLRWQTDFECSRDGELDGLLGWFDCRLFADIHMTNSPTTDFRLDRPQAFFPLECAVRVHKGEKIRTSVMARPADRILAWTIELPERGEQFSLSTFNGLLLDDETLEHSHRDRVAQLNDRGKALRIVLSYCDGVRTVAEVEAKVRKEHPDLFPSALATTKFIQQALAWNTKG